MVSSPGPATYPLCGARELLLAALLGVQLDDQLFADGDRDVLALRQRDDLPLELCGVELEPRGDPAALRGLDRGGDERVRAALVLDGHDRALRHDHARDVDLAAVHAHVPVPDELAGLRARAREAEPVHDVVETALEQREQVLARDAPHALGLLEREAELALENPVEALDLLLLAELDAVPEDLRPALAVLTRGEIAALDGALVGEAAVPLEEQLHSFAPAQPADRFAITSHGK